MDYLHRCGYPVPAIEKISNDGLDLIMERIDGPTMMQAISNSPWTVRRLAHLLADVSHLARGPFAGPLHGGIGPGCGTCQQGQAGGRQEAGEPATAAGRSRVHSTTVIGGASRSTSSRRAMKGATSVTATPSTNGAAALPAARLMRCRSTGPYRRSIACGTPDVFRSLLVMS